VIGFVTEMECIHLSVSIFQIMLALKRLNVYAVLAEKSLSLVTSLKSLRG